MYPASHSNFVRLHAIYWTSGGWVLKIFPRRLSRSWSGKARSLDRCASSDTTSISGGPSSLISSLSFQWTKACVCLSISIYSSPSRPSHGSHRARGPWQTEPSGGRSIIGLSNNAYDSGVDRLIWQPQIFLIFWPLPLPILMWYWHTVETGYFDYHLMTKVGYYD